MKSTRFPTERSRQATGVDLRGIRRGELRALAFGGAEVGGLWPEAMNHWPRLDVIFRGIFCGFY